jgi:hypothetical protein
MPGVAHENIVPDISFYPGFERAAGRHGLSSFFGRNDSVQLHGDVKKPLVEALDLTAGLLLRDPAPISLKLYDKFGLMRRIETTVNDLTFFKHYREVEHRGTKETKWASMQNTIYTLPALREILEAANRR